MPASISLSPAFYARIIQVLDTGDEASRKSLKEELLEILQKDENDCLHVASRKSGEEPPLKKMKHSEEKNGNQNDEAKDSFDMYKRNKAGSLTEFVAKHYREDVGGVQLDFEHPEKFLKARLADEIVIDGKEFDQLDFTSTKPWYLKRLRPGLKW